MKIQFSNIWLAANSLESPFGIRLDGQQITDDALFFRAASRTVYGRANKSHELQFSVWKSFASIAAAQVFTFIHWGALPGTGPLQITCGAPGETPQIVTLIGAVLAGPQTMPCGLSVLVTYRFLGGLFTTEIVTLPDEDSMLKRDTADLSQGDTEKAIVFAAPFGAVPVITCRVHRPSGSADTVPDWDAPIDGTTPAGFTARGQPIPGAGYKLSWIAVGQ